MKRTDLIIIANDKQTIMATNWLNQIADLIGHAEKYMSSTRPTCRMLRHPDAQVFGYPVYFDQYAPLDKVYAISALVPDRAVVVS